MSILALCLVCSLSKETSSSREPLWTDRLRSKAALSRSFSGSSALLESMSNWISSAGPGTITSFCFWFGSGSFGLLEDLVGLLLVLLESAALDGCLGLALSLDLEFAALAVLLLCLKSLGSSLRVKEPLFSCLVGGWSSFALLEELRWGFGAGSECSFFSWSILSASSCASSLDRWRGGEGCFWGFAIGFLTGLMGVGDGCFVLGFARGAALGLD